MDMNRKEMIKIIEVNYEEIDELCIPLVKFFNSVGLITEFSCQGHDNRLHNSFQIIFHKSVTDEIITEFIKKYSGNYEHSPFCGRFVKWARKLSGEVVCTWEYVISYGDYEKNQRYACSDYCKLITNDETEVSLTNCKIIIKRGENIG